MKSPVTWRALDIGFLAIMGAVCFAASRTLEMYLGVSRWMLLLELAVTIPLGLGVFYGLCRLSRLPELESARRARARSVRPPPRARVRR